MTLVLASRCVDGVVVVADRKITKLGTHELRGYDDKTSGVIRNVIFGYAGSEAFYKIFVRYVVGDIIILRDAPERYTYGNLIQKFCTIMDLFRETYRNPIALDVVIARLSPTKGQSDLYLVRADGNQQQILEWRAIGSGELVANKIVSEFWNNEIDMKYFAEIGYSIIKYFEEEIPDQLVGVGKGNNPSIRYLENGAETDASQDEFSDFENGYTSHKEEFKRILGHAEP